MHKNIISGEIDDFQSKSDKFPNQKEQYRFRVGENPEDRFYSIFLHGDPWEKSSLVYDISVNFVGASGGFESTMSFENFSCRFTYPIPVRIVLILSTDIVYSHLSFYSSFSTSTWSHWMCLRKILTRSYADK